jgi:hypothetical protein
MAELAALPPGPDLTPPVPMHMPMPSAWGFPVTLTCVHEGFATRPVEYNANGVICTPTVVLYSLSMSTANRGKLPSHLQRRAMPKMREANVGRKLSRSVNFPRESWLDLTLAELMDAL